MYLLLSLYMMKFATDVLLIAPAVMGLIYSASRIWDAVSDPLVGYLSDRTTTRLGRRRSWLLISSLPIAITFYMVFAPPQSLEGPMLIAWVAVAVIGFYSAMTLFFVPHLSLGAELSDDYHERRRTTAKITMANITPTATRPSSAAKPRTSPSVAYSACNRK